MTGLHDGLRAVAGLHTFLLRERISIFSPGFKGHLSGSYYLHHQFLRVATGMKVFGISKAELRNLILQIPPFTEQTAIAKALSDVEALVDKLDELIAKKRDLKQATMQQLLTGKVRLPGFSAKWKNKKISELAVCFSGGTPLTSNKSFYGGCIPWITSSDLNNYKIRSVSGKITEFGLKNSSAKIVKAGTLLVALYGATAGVSAITEINAAINQAVLAIEGNNETNTYFLLSYFTLQKDNIIKTYTQGGQPNLSGQIIKNLHVNVPSYDEQTAIATVLSDMDTEITTLEARRDKTRLLKQGMMQELLTGRIRLI